jgi:hypothetical protein
MGYPVISRFYSHLRAGGFHPNPTGPSNIFQPTLIMSASTCHSTVSRRTYISKKKKTIQKNRTPRLQIQPAAGPVAASIPDRRQRAQPRRSPTRSRPLAQTSDSEHNPGGRGLWFPSTGLCILGEWFGLGIACILAKFAEA